MSAPGTRPDYQQLALGEGDEQVPTGSDEPTVVLQDAPNVTLPAITVKKGRWRQSVTVIGLLVNAGSLDGPHPPELVGVARLDVHPRGHNESRHNVDISRAELLERAALWQPVLDELPDVRLAETLGGEPELLTGGVASRFLAAAERHAGPGFLALAFGRLARSAAERTAGDLDRRDRRARLLEIGGMRGVEPRVLAPEDVPNKVYELYERDMLSHDEKSWDPTWRRTDSADKLWFVYERDGRRLFVRDWDTGLGEHVTGGDMVYVRVDPPSVVAVQYKRLVLAPGRYRRPSCRIDDTFRSQVRRLAELARPSAGSSEATPATVADYRVSTLAGFFKLVDARPVGEDGYMYDGWYLPADYLQLLLDQADAAGEHDAAGAVISLDLDRDRFINTPTFVALVGDGWIGTAGGKVEELMTRLRLRGLLSDEQPSTVAVELPAPPTPPTARRRSARQRPNGGMRPQ